MSLGRWGNLFVARHIAQQIAICKLIKCSLVVKNGEGEKLYRFLRTDKHAKKSSVFGNMFINPL